MTDPRLAQATAYFSRLYARLPSTNGLASLCAKRGDQVVVRHVAASDPAAIIHTAIELDGHGFDTYVGVAVRDPSLAGSTRRGTKGECTALTALFADVDLLAPGHAAQNLPADPVDAIRTVAAAVGAAPSMVVHSGGGLHPYWLLEDPLLLDTAAARREADEMLKALGARIEPAFAARGWHFDTQVQDLSRILRVPGTYNRKVPTEPRACYVLDASGPSYSAAYWRQSTGPAVGGVPLAAPLTPSPGSPHPPEGVTPSAGGPVEPPPADEAVREHVHRSLRGIIARQRPTADLADRILNGRALARPGHRDAELQRATSLLAFVSPARTTAHQIADLLRPALEAMAAEANDPTNPSPDLEDATEKATRALADAERARAESSAGDADFLRRVRAARGIATPSPTTDTPPSDPEEPPPSVYTDEEIANFAATLGCTPAELPRRWIIQHGTAFYVLGAHGTYLPPIPEISLEVSLPRDLAPAPIDWTTYDAKGTPRRKKASEVVRDYATVARRVIADLTIETGSYNPTTQEFREAGPRRRIEPMFDERVDRWLRLLGGEHADKLLDWIATLDQLDRQTSALLLEGRKGAGKGMLAAGLAKRWTTGGPTELKSIGNFNGDILRCPLIFVDEKMPTGWDVTDLRELIGCTQRSLTRKYLPNSDVYGAVRAVLCANGVEILSLGDKDHGREALDATADRILHIHVTDAPAEYLRSIGGPAGTHDWVSGDRIARHAMWLKANRRVVPGGRFLVEGNAAALSRMLALQTTSAGLVAEWVVRVIQEWADAGFLARPGSPIAMRHVIVGAGRVLVNATTVAQHWDNYVKGGGAKNTPTTTRVGSVLRTWSGGRWVRVGPRRLRSIPLDVLLEWADLTHVGDRDLLVTATRRPLDVTDVVEEGEAA